MFKSLILCVAFLGQIHAQCSSVGYQDGGGPSIGGQCPTGQIAVGAVCCLASSTTSAYATTVTSSSINSGTVTSGCVGPCIGNQCPTSYTCDSTSQTCCSSSTTGTTGTTGCQDKIGADGTSDCPRLASLCNSTVYATIMAEQCPKTCNKCTTTTSTGTTGTTGSTTCVDKVNPTTGTSDCASLAYLCNESLYRTIMTQQCPRTCGRCSTSTSTLTG